MRLKCGRWDYNDPKQIQLILKTFMHNSLASIHFLTSLKPVYNFFSTSLQIFFQTQFITLSSVLQMILLELMESVVSSM